MGLSRPLAGTYVPPHTSEPSVAYVNVQDYGAMGVPGVDYTEQVQAAVDAASHGNAALLLPPGEYGISAPIIVDARAFIGIVGVGASLVSTVPQTAAAALVIRGDAATRIELLGVALKHTGSGTTTTLTGLSVPATVASIYARNVVIGGFANYGADVLASQQTWIACAFVDNRHAGLGAGGAGTISLVDVDASNNGNGVDHSEGYGVVLSGGSSEIIGGRFRDNDRYGIDVRRANNAVIDGAFVSNSGYVGIYGVNEDGEKDASNVKIVGCTIDMAGRPGSEHAIWIGAYGSQSVADFDEALVSGNTIRNALRKGVLISSGGGARTARKVIVVDNALQDVAGAAIEISGASVVASAVVSRNVLRATGNVVLANVANVIVSENVRTMNPGGNASSFVAVTGEANAVITGNVSDGTYLAAPFTWSAPQFAVRDNVVSFGPMLREVVAAKPGIPDSVETAFLDIGVPNTDIGGTLLVDYVVNDADKGAVYYTGQLCVQVVRSRDVAAQRSVTASVAPRSLSTASRWARTIALSFSAAVAGPADAQNTVSLTITCDTSDGLGAHLRYSARFLFGGKDSGTDVMSLSTR